MNNTDEKIVIIGYGWVGQANALALKQMGCDVAYFDVGDPILHYVDEYRAVYKSILALSDPLAWDGEHTWYVVSVGDRVSEDGVQDISLIKSALESVQNTRGGGIILRSTVLPKSLPSLDFDYYVPEFLHEKFAVEECVAPHYFVVGYRRDIESMPSFLKEWEARSTKVFRGTPEEAAFIKYLSNIWNAIRIAFVNEFGDAIGKPGTKHDIAKIERVLDYVLERKSYLKYGRAFDGHCLPKDMRAFIRAYGSNNATELLEGAYKSNERHKEIQEHYTNLPEWYSSWDEMTVRRIDTVFGRMWRAINKQPLVRSVRRQLRFLKDWLECLGPRPSFERQRRVWDAFAEDHPLYYMNPRTPSGREVTTDEFWESGQRDVERYLEEDSLLREALGDLSDKTVLEIGSGAGRMTVPLSKRVATLYGTDISSVLLKLAEEQAAGIHNVTLKATSGDTLPYDDASMDLVFSYLSLHTLPYRRNLENYLKEIRRVLRKGGMAKLQLRTGAPPRKWTRTYGIAVTPREVRALATQVGLAVVSHTIEGESRHLWVWLQKKK